jgi:putative oxidoreductase
MNRLLALYDRVISHFQYPQSILLLIIRVYWGVQLAQSGWGKLHHLDKVTDYFQSINVPMPGPTAHMVALLELVTGIFWILGLFSRPISAIMTINLFAAYWFGDHEAFLSFFSDPDKFTGAAPFQFLLVSLIVLLFGPGFISLDAVLRKFVVKKPSPAQVS